MDESGESVDDKFKADLYQREINRVVYLLKSYLRTRLLKITRHAKFILSKPELLVRLSGAEAELIASPYVELMDSHLHNSFLVNMPEKMQKLKVKLEKSILCLSQTQVIHLLSSVRIPRQRGDFSGHHHSLEAGDIFAVRYQAIEALARTASACVNDSETVGIATRYARAAPKPSCPLHTASQLHGSLEAVFHNKEGRLFEVVVKRFPFVKKMKILVRMRHQHSKTAHHMAWRSKKHLGHLVAHRSHGRDARAHARVVMLCPFCPGLVADNQAFTLRLVTDCDFRASCFASHLFRPPASHR